MNQLARSRDRFSAREQSVEVFRVSLQIGNLDVAPSDPVTNGPWVGSCVEKRWTFDVPGCLMEQRPHLHDIEPPLRLVTSGEADGRAPTVDDELAGVGWDWDGNPEAVALEVAQHHGLPRELGLGKIGLFDGQVADNGHVEACPPDARSGSMPLTPNARNTCAGG